MQKVRKPMKKILYFLLLLALFLALPVMAAAEGEEEVDESNPYGIFVGGVAVTKDNASDILGDGTAFYTAQNDTLTLRRYHSEQFYTQKGVLYSVYCGGKTNIVIEGKNNRFPQGIYTEKGNITLKGADVTFGNSAFLMLHAPAGTLSLSDSQLVLGDLSFVQSDSYCVTAKEIIVQKSEIRLDTDTPTTTYCNSILYGSSAIAAEKSSFSFSLPYPIAASMFLGGDMLFENCDIYLRRGNYGFHTQWGAVQFSDCDVVVEETRSFSSSPDFVAIDTTIEATLFYQGIHAVGSTDGEGFVAVSSKLVLKMLPFEDIESTIMRSIWNNMDASERVEFGQSYDAFIATFKNTTYKTATEGNAGIAVTGGGCYLHKTRMQINGFDAGILGLYGIPLEIDTRCDLRLSAKRVAFLWFAYSYEGVSIGSNRLTGTLITYTDVPESMQNAGAIAVCSSDEHPTFKAGAEVETTADILNRIEGTATDIRIRTAPYTGSIIIVSVIVTAVALAFIFACVMIFLPSLRMSKSPKGNSKKK